MEGEGLQYVPVFFGVSCCVGRATATEKKKMMGKGEEPFSQYSKHNYERKVLNDSEEVGKKRTRILRSFKKKSGLSGLERKRRKAGRKARPELKE
jgi:hypothetical protein